MIYGPLAGGLAFRENPAFILGRFDRTKKAAVRLLRTLNHKGGFSHYIQCKQENTPTNVANSTKIVIDLAHPNTQSAPELSYIYPSSGWHGRKIRRPRRRRWWKLFLPCAISDKSLRNDKKQDHVSPTPPGTEARSTDTFTSQRN